MASETRVSLSRGEGRGSYDLPILLSLVAAARRVAGGPEFHFVIREGAVQFTFRNAGTADAFRRTSEVRHALAST